MEKKIKDIVKELETKFPLNDREEIEMLFDEIDSNEIELLFSVSLVGTNSSDWWLQADYYSKKIGKTIIWDYDFLDSYENVEELISVITRTNKEVEDFENKLSVYC